MSSNKLLLDQQLCFALYSTSLAMTKLYKPLLAEIGLTYPQYLVMLTLWERDGILLKTLADRLHQDSGALTPVLKRLEAEGYLVRRRGASDERSLSLELTDAGRALQQKALQVNQAVGTACGLDNTEMNELRTRLNTLRQRLEDD